MQNYNPHSFEEQPFYQEWEKQDFFNPDQSGADKTFSLVIPPPNVTGYLHIGHALVNSLNLIAVFSLHSQIDLHCYKIFGFPNSFQIISCSSKAMRVVILHKQFSVVLNLPA